MGNQGVPELSGDDACDAGEIGREAGGFAVVAESPCAAAARLRDHGGSSVRFGGSHRCR